MTTSDYIGPEQLLPLPDPPELEAVYVNNNREVALREAVKMWGLRVGRNGHHFSQDEARDWVLLLAKQFNEWLEKD